MGTGASLVASLPHFLIDPVVPLGWVLGGVTPLGGEQNRIVDF